MCTIFLSDGRKLIIDNILPKIQPTSSILRNQAANSQYCTNSYHNDDAEGNSFADFSHTFYKLLQNNQTIPSISDYYQNIREQLESHPLGKEKMKNEDFRNGMEARVKSRTFPSLVRDIHFAKLIAEKVQNTKVIVSPELDVRGIDITKVIVSPELDVRGIDILLIDSNDNRYGLCLYLKSNVSDNELIRKREKRKNFQGINFVELPFKPKIGQQGIWLYDDNDFETLKTNLAKNQPSFKLQ